MAHQRVQASTSGHVCVTWRRTMHSVCVAARLANDRSPLLDLRLEQRSMCSRGDLVGGVDGCTKFGHATGEVGILGSRLHGCDNLVDGRLGCSLRRIQAMPDADLEVFQA